MRLSELTTLSAAALILLLLLLGGGIYLNTQAVNSLQASYEQRQTYVNLGQQMANASDYLIRITDRLQTSVRSFDLDETTTGRSATADGEPGHSEGETVESGGDPCDMVHGGGDGHPAGVEPEPRWESV